MQSDAELVKTVLDGEKTAFSALIKRYERPVRAVTLNVLQDYHLAADASQEAFLAAYRKLSALRKPESFGPWLMKIARRCATNTAQRRTPGTSLETTAAETLESRLNNPNGQLDEDKQRLLAAVLKLSANERQVIMLRYFAGHSVQDIADILSRGVGTVTKQLSRARVRLRKRLKGIEK